MKIFDLQEELLKMQKNIENILKKTGYFSYGEPENVSYNADNPEDCYIMDNAQKIMNHLSEVYRSLDYMMSKKREGKLSKKSNGRYAIADKEFTCGDILEIDVEDCWIRTSIEHNGSDYFLVGFSEIEMEGLHVRIRE